MCYIYKSLFVQILLYSILVKQVMRIKKLELSIAAHLIYMLQSQIPQ